VDRATVPSFAERDACETPPGMSGDRPRIRRLPLGAWIAFGVAVLIGFALLGVDNRWAHLVAFLLPALTITVATRLLERK
jgi:hypothetical protein